MEFAGKNTKTHKHKWSLDDIPTCFLFVFVPMQILYLHKAQFISVCAKGTCTCLFNQGKILVALHTYKRTFFLSIRSASAKKQFVCVCQEIETKHLSN